MENVQRQSQRPDRQNVLAKSDIAKSVIFTHTTKSVKHTARKVAALLLLSAMPKIGKLIYPLTVVVSIGPMDFEIGQK